MPQSASQSAGAGAWGRWLLLLVGLHVALGLPYIDRVPRVYNDDAWLASLGYNLAFEGRLRHGIIEGWGGMHIRFVQNQVVQPVVLAAVYRVAGFSLTASRLASVAAGAVALVAACCVLRRWLGDRGAQLAALATVFHPWFFEASRRVRPDIYAVALAWLCLWSLLAARERADKRLLALAGALAGLAGLTHPTGFVLCMAMAGAVLLWYSGEKRGPSVLWAAVGLGLAVLPYVVYLLWATRHPEVSLSEQMQGGKSLVPQGLGLILAGELRRWAHFAQWPRGAPLAAVMVLAYVSAWWRSERSDRLMATMILLLALALPFTTVNYTSRYLVGLIPLWAALVLRLAERLARSPHGGNGGPRRGRLIRTGVFGGYVGLCAVAVAVMFVRLRGADFGRVLDKVASVTGSQARVYGEIAFWLGRDRFAYGPYPLDHHWRSTVDEVAKHRFDYAVRTAWSLTASEGISRPPARMPPWRGGYIVDTVCRQFGRQVAAFRDPDFGPVEIYRLTWE